VAVIQNPVERPVDLDGYPFAYFSCSEHLDPFARCCPLIFA
jgi:hypothetical protein